MIYGLYLSASGVMTNAYRQDVIANNLANSETVGFKRDLAIFQERRTALQEGHAPGGYSDPMLENMGGGILAMPTLVDVHQGDVESTGNPLDVAIEGDGYFSVTDGKTKHLTRDGHFMINQAGELILGNAKGHRVLDQNGQTIKVDPQGPVTITKDGQLQQRGELVGTIGLFDVSDHSAFTKQGGTLLTYPDEAQIHPATAVLRSESTESANVDPTTELAELMETQRNLEANANMIHNQDQMLQKLVNDVGKIS